MGGGGKIRRGAFWALLFFWSAFWGRDPPEELRLEKSRRVAGSASESVGSSSEKLRWAFVGLGTRVRNTDLVIR